MNLKRKLEVGSEKWIEEKAEELAEIFRNPERAELYKAVINTEYFIRQLVKEIQPQKPDEEKVKKLMEKWADKFDAFIYNNPGLIIDVDWIKQMLQEYENLRGK